MSESQTPSPASADDLPPVEPPSASFILQLFVLPAVIVIVIVTVWMMFSWLARTKTDPESFLIELRRPSAARWQVAGNLGTALRDDPDLAHNGEFATQLATILGEEIKAGQMTEDAIKFRCYLCRALGNFYVPEGLPMLLTAAQTHRDDKESLVQLTALEGVALLAGNLREAQAKPDPNHSNPNSEAQIKAALDSPELQGALLKAATDDNNLFRSTAACAMGFVRGEPLEAKLHELIADAYPDTRYNAALALSQLGDAAALPVLLEMLDPENTVGVEIETNPEQRADKRATLEINALRGARFLAARNATLDAQPLVTAIEKLLTTNPPGQIRIQSKETLIDLHKRSEKGATNPTEGPTAIP